MHDLSCLPTIVALSLLAEPGEESLAVGQSQYRGAGLLHLLEMLVCVPLALENHISQQGVRLCVCIRAQSFR